MNVERIQEGDEAESDASSFARQMSDAGVALFHGTITGEITATAPEKSPRRINLLTSILNPSTIFRDAFAAAVVKWNEQEQPETFEIFAGLWMCGMPQMNRRSRVGYDVALFATDDFLRSESFTSMCQSAMPADTDIESYHRRLKVSTKTSVARMADVIRLAHAQKSVMAEMANQQSSLTTQLAESYEEMNLLYTITQNMTMRDPSERYITRSCQELLATLPYAWIGLQLAANPQKLKSISGRFIVVGQAAQSVAVLRTTSQLLLENIEQQAPLVLEPVTNSKHEDYRPLGHTALVQPVVMSGEIVGLLLAADKRGSDAAVSNIDIKMLGAAATHMSIFLENAALYDDLNAMFLGTLEALTASIDAKDRYTCGHSRRVAHLTQLLARAVGLDDYKVSRCHIAGLVHDVGKIGVPESVLLKPGKLNDEEFALIKMHPEIGHRILKDIPQLNDVLPGVLHHHERWDGRGYPGGLKGEAIPMVARLIGMADSFDAMSSTRTYRSALSRGQVIDEIQKCAGVQFDPSLAPTFVNLDFAEYDRLVHEHHASESSSIRRAA